MNISAETALWRFLNGLDRNECQRDISLSGDDKIADPDLETDRQIAAAKLVKHFPCEFGEVDI